MPNSNTNSTMLDNNKSTKKKNTDAKIAISNTVIVANIVSLLVAQVILFNSCLTCLTNCAGLVLDISILPKCLSIYLFFLLSQNLT